MGSSERSAESEISTEIRDAEAISPSISGTGYNAQNLLPSLSGTKERKKTGR
jgi:hypothetical protein